jgi:hypothetical protein
MRVIVLSPDVSITARVRRRSKKTMRSMLQRKKIRKKFDPAPWPG